MSALAERVARGAVGNLALRVEHVPGLPLVSARVWLRGGVRHEAKPGVGCLTGRLLGEGTHRLDFRQLAEEAESRGVWQSAFGTGETLGLALDALAVDWRWTLDRMVSMLLEPSFPEERLDWLRRQAAAELEAALDQPDVRTGLAFLEQLYAPHPYGRPIQGDRRALEAVTRRDCLDYHRRCLGWGGCLAVVGDVDPAAVLEHLERALVGSSVLEASPEPAPAPPPIRGLEARRQVRAGEADQAHLFLGHLSIPRAHPDAAALEVLAVVLGAGGLAGRLPTRLREREGLAYHVDVSTAAGAGLDPGRLTVYLGTSPRQVEHAESAIREELERVVTEGVRQEELEEALGYLLGREPFRRETLRRRADLQAEAELYGLPVDGPEWWPERLREVDLPALEAATRRWVRPGELRVTVGVPRSAEKGA